MISKVYEIGHLKTYKYVVVLSAYGGKILLSRHRERTTWETQGGHVEPGETPFEAAKRELREETGAIAGKYTFLGELDTTPALMDEKIYLYMAEDISFGERELDDDEFLDIETVPLTELLDMVMRGEIKDAKTQIAILKAARIFSER